MTPSRIAAALLALGSLAALPACSTPSYYSQAGSAAPMPASQELSPAMVRQVQTALQQQNLYNGPIDGVWGPQTQSAVQSFQQSHSLSANGQLNSQTLAALNLPASDGASANNSAMPSSSSMQSPDMVRQVQAALQQQGLYRGTVDGVWGPRTQGAVQSFQQSHSLSATGQLDSQTMAALNLPNNNGAPNTQSSAAPPPSQNQATQSQANQAPPSQGQLQSNGTMTTAPSSDGGNSSAPMQSSTTMPHTSNTAATSTGTPSSTATP